MTYDEALDHILSDLPAFLEATEDALCEALTTDGAIELWGYVPTIGREKKIEAAKAERDVARNAAKAMMNLAHKTFNSHTLQFQMMTSDEKAIGRLMAHFVEKAAARMAEGVR